MRAFGLDEEVSMLTTSERLVVAASAGLDAGLRTATAGILTAALAPLAASSTRLDGDLAQLATYAELAARHTPEELTRPDGPTPTPTRARSTPLPVRWRGGTLDLLRFPSGYVPVNDAVVAAHGARRNNATTWAHHWRHPGPPRPTLIVLHGFGASPVTFNRDFFSVPWLYGRGLDVLLVSLPFHGRRRSRPTIPSGIELFSSGLTLFNEGLLQAVHDVRRWVDALLEDGAPAVGVTGLSLGGYVAATTAATDDRLAACIPNAAVVDVARLLPSWAPAGPMVLRVLERRGLPPSVLEDALRVHSPLRAAPLLARDRLMVIGGLGDRLAPPSQTQLLWEHWQRPDVHWFPGNHVLHYGRGVYTRRLAEFLDANGLALEPSHRGRS